MTHNELKEILQDKLAEIVELIEDNMVDKDNNCEQSQLECIFTEIVNLCSVIHNIKDEDLLSLSNLHEVHF